MKIILFLLLCGAMFSALGQKGQEFGADINNAKSARHVNIPGTRVYVILPDGFKIRANKAAIFKDSSEFMTLLDWKEPSFYHDAKGLTKEDLQLGVKRLLDYKELKVNGFAAIFAVRQFDSGEYILNLFFGDSTFCATIIGHLKSGDDETEKQAENLLSSIYFDKAQVVDPFTTALFKLDDTKSIFKFTDASGFNFTYLTEGEKPALSNNKPSFVVYTLPIKDIPFESLVVLFSDPFPQKAIIKNPSDKKVNGLKSHQMEMYGHIKSKQVLLFRHLVAIDGSVIVMEGTAYDNFDKYLPEFKKLSATITKK